MHKITWSLKGLHRAFRYVKFWKSVLLTIFKQPQTITSTDSPHNGLPSSQKQTTNNQCSPSSHAVLSRQHWTEQLMPNAIICRSSRNYWRTFASDFGSVADNRIGLELQETRCVVNETYHGMKFYSKVLALYMYTSFPTERRAQNSIRGFNYIFRATLQSLTYFHSITRNTTFTHV